MKKTDCIYAKALLDKLTYSDGKLFWKKTGRRAGTINATLGYRRVMITVGGVKRGFYEHRVVWLLHYGAWPKNNIDHINRNKTDNRIENLRDCGQAVNLRNANRSVVSRTGFTGVYERPSGKFAAQTKYKGEPIWLGVFDTVGDAALAKAAFDKKSLRALLGR